MTSERVGKVKINNIDRPFLHVQNVGIFIPLVLSPFWHLLSKPTDPKEPTLDCQILIMNIIYVSDIRKMTMAMSTSTALGDDLFSIHLMKASLPTVFGKPENWTYCHLPAHWKHAWAKVCQMISWRTKNSFYSINI